MQIYVVKEIHSDNPDPPITYFNSEEKAKFFCILLNNVFDSLEFIYEKYDLQIHESIDSACKEWGL